jgi:hypothetical protein
MCQIVLFVEDTYDILVYFKKITCIKIIRDVQCGDKNKKWQQQKQQYNNHNFESLYPIFANHHNVVLQSSVRPISG